MLGCGQRRAQAAVSGSLAGEKKRQRTGSQTPGDRHVVAAIVIDVTKKERLPCRPGKEASLFLNTVVGVFPNDIDTKKQPSALSHLKGPEGPRLRLSLLVRALFFSGNHC